MGTRSTFLVLTVLTVFFVAGCGEDNNDNEGPGATATLTVTPAATPTATQTPVDGVTPTPTQTPAAGETLTPTPAPTGGACEADQMVLTVTSAAGSDLDTGWTGIAHDSVAVEGSKVEIDLIDCADGECTIDGTALVGTRFGSPLPLSAGGTGACVTNTFREPVTGTYNCATGCSESQARLTSSVFLAQLIEHPCPLCLGDPTPNDGNKDGTCDDGPNKGDPCDVGGISTSLGGSPNIAPTSNDCQPSGTSVGDLEINLVPLTTGTAATTANVTCFSSRVPGLCYCADSDGPQDRPNQCDDGICTTDADTIGVCEAGPVDLVCANQKFRFCESTRDCEDIFPGAGACVLNTPRPCFGASISRTGQCGVTSGTLAAHFCIPRTTAPAINQVSGLPGPGAVTLPVTTVRRPR